MTTVWRERVLEPSKDTCAEFQPVPVRFKVLLCTLGKAFSLVSLCKLLVSCRESNPIVLGSMRLDI